MKILRFNVKCCSRRASDCKTFVLRLALLTHFSHTRNRYKRSYENMAAEAEEDGKPMMIGGCELPNMKAVTMFEGMRASDYDDR